MKAILSLIISGALVVSGYAQTRNVLVGTNNAVVQPTNFWSADASNARTGLGLGSAATNPASAFQSSSATLSNLATGNGAGLTNITATIVGTNISITNVSGLQSALDEKLATNGSAGGLTNFPVNVLQTNSLLTAFPAGLLRTNGDATNLTNFPALLLRTNGNGAGLTNIVAANITGTVALASNVTGTVAIVNGGSGATTAGGARINLELGATNNVVFNSLHAEQDANSGVYTLTLGQTNTGFRGLGAGTSDFVFARNGTSILGLASGEIQSYGVHNFSKQLTLSYGAGNTAVIAFSGIDSATGAAISRTNLGLGWPALTNTTASGFQTALFGTGTNPVLVDTNGEVVSPTNFWQAAPITTTFIESQPTTNSSTNISPSRLLHIHSLATNIVNTTNTIVLPTNTLTFEGDMAMVVHKGPTNSLTQVRQAGSTNNLITLSNFNEAVEFTYYNDNWQFLETVAFTDPIYFSGTNAEANVAESRTNLGLGWSALTNTNAENFYTSTLTTYSLISAAILDDAGGVRSDIGLSEGDSVRFGGITNDGNITINQWNATNGLLFIYRTNAEPFLGLANLIASNNTTVSNESLFRVGVAEATNKAAQFGFRSTNTNGNGVAVFSVFGYNALMMVGPSDPNAGTNPIQATVYSVAPTNKVMTLITTNTGATLFHRAIEVEGTTNQAVTRTNLGLPLDALTNTSVTNFQKAIFYTNTAPSNIGGNLGTIAAWIEIVASNGVTYKIPAYTNVP